MGGTVRGEEEQAADGSPRRARTGPRHAAPRKSMLTRLQVPAGKAIALAAMPTAVLMGMGLTPQLASANTRAEDRYKAGPCVSQPDEADKDDAEGKKDTSDGKDGKDGKDTDGTDGKDQGSKSPSGSSDSSDSSGGGDTAPAKPTPTTPTPSPSGSSGSGDEEESEEPSASPSPSESETKNPLDPLGIGDKLHDVFNPDDADEDEASAEPSATPSPSASSATPSPSPSTEKTADNPVKDTVDKVGDGAKDTVDKAEKAAEDAKDKADKALPKPSPSGSPSDGADGGKVGYPCPEFDADAYKNAEDEPTASPLPDDPWVLKTTMLSLHGLDYKGIVDVKTHNGQSKKVLKFTAEGVDIKDLHQLVKGPAGTTTNVAAREGSTSTFRNGTVTMYTEELKGNLLGIIPITFSPKSPPPVNIPEVFFTDVTVTQAGQFGGELTIPGMHVYKTGE
ncbi:hydrogenase expression protein HypF [Streptomyces botrytidirepellens]|uniref:Hydrogenase expression protein HypF n=2 Tax=Streptomyces botrytidirepellens TaxID=2486417 RepID=A0A3M8WFT8_9ACTN|nr:hydrogenase expression protein HypF [Streptomyces botrytidirepellens]